MSNNYSLARFIAAVTVILGHAFFLSTGVEGRITSYIGGRYAVAFFFYGGGFFLARSLTAKGTNGFIRARIDKIFPELAVCIIGTVLLLGPIMSTLAIKEYFLNGQTYLYLLNAIFILIHNLPGVFAENIYTSTVNGSLWTLPVEMLCYVGIYILAGMKLLSCKRMKYTIPVFIVGIGILLFCLKGNEVLRSAVVPICMFYIGILYYIYRQKIPVSNILGISALIGTWIFYNIGLYYIAFIFLYPYAIYVLINSNKQVGKKAGFLGNISYAMYLVGFPIQQTVVALYGGKMGAIQNIVISVPIDICIAIIVYQIVCKLKNKVGAKRNVIKQT